MSENNEDIKDDVKFLNINEDVKEKHKTEGHNSVELTSVFKNKINNHYARDSVVKMNEELIIGIDDVPLKKSYIKNFNITRINIENCKGFEHAVDRIRMTSLETGFGDSDDIILIKLEYDNKFEDFTSSEMSMLMNLCNKQSIVIHLESKNRDKFSIYWKSKELDYFLTTKPYETQITKDDAELYGFVAEFLANELGCGYLGISNKYHFNEESNQFDIVYFSDSRNYNLLLLACEAGKTNLAICLFKYGLNIEVPDQYINIQDIALQNRHFDLVKALYAEDVPLPAPGDISTYPKDFMAFIDQLSEFFENIAADNLEKVEEIHSQLPNTRYFYNFSNESALKVAVKSSSFKCYEFLVSHKHTFAPNEDPEEIYEELEYEDQKILREIHNKYTQESPEKHINVLMTKSFIAHDVTDAEQKLKIVRKAYRSLSTNFIIRIVLMVVAASKNFKIIFDFNRDSVNVADPTATSNTQGLFYTSGRIYIGAKQLLNEATACETLAVIAHEFCHYAINLVYGNDARPYKANDNKAIQEFEDISSHCAANKGKEEVVDVAYEYYPPDMHHAELIVRVVHLLALYSKNPERLAEVREIFGCLFEFFEKKVVPEMKEALPEIEGHAEKEILKKDKKISKFKKISLIAGLLAILGVIGAIFVGIIFHKPVYKFNELSTDEQLLVMNSTVVYKDVEVRFKDLFGVDSVAYEKLTSDHIGIVLEGGRLDFGDPYLHYLDELVVLDFINLTDKLKLKFLSSNFTFQNESVKFIDLHGHVSKSFNLLSSQNIVDVLDGKKLIVDKMIENRTEFYVERIFWNEDILDIYSMFTKQNFKVNDWENEEKFCEFYDQFVGQNISDYIDKINESKNSAQFRLFFVSRADNTLDILLNFSSFHDNFDTILNNAEASKVLILSSEAGTGKTVNFEQFAMRIKRKYPINWVSYIDLKDYTKFYSQNGTIDDPEALLSKILNLSTKSSFEQSIFHELYQSGSVVLLWNGFDEISPAFNKFILDILISIHSTTSNIQFVCTRPLYSRQLVESLKVLPYTLVSFSKDQQYEFLSKFFKSRKIDDSLIQSYINKTQKIVKSLILKTTIARSTEEFNTPLMLEMIADLISDNVDIFESENLYEIYHKFVKKKIDIWREKSEFAIKFLGDSVTEYRKFDMLEMYQMFALKNELRSISPFTHLVSGKLKIMRQKIPKELTSVEISRMGILYINGKNEFKFSHKTFAEFFVAQFFVENLYNADGVDSEDAVVLLHNFEYVTEYYGIDQVMTTNFMISYLQTQNDVVSDGFEPKIVEMFRKKFKRIFFNILRDKRADTFKFLFEFFKKDHKLLVELLGVDENETLYTASFNCAYFPDQSDNFNRKVLKELGKKYLNLQEYDNFIYGRDQKGIILYGLYVFNRQDVGKTGVRRVFHDEYDLSEKVLNNENKIVVLGKIIKLLSKSEVKELLTSITSPLIYKEFDLINHPKFWNISQKFLSRPDQKLQISNLFIGLSKFNDPEPYLPILVTKTLEIFTPLETHKLFKSKNILHRSVNNFVPFWNFFVNQTTQNQQSDILTLKTDGECIYYSLYAPNQKCYYYPPLNIFHVTLISQYTGNYDSLQAFEFIRETYQRYFDKLEMQEIILDSNDFMPFLIRLTPFESCEKFMEFLKDLFEGSERKLKEFLLRRIHPTNFNIFEYLDNIGVENINKNVKLLVDVLDYIDKL